MTGRLVSPGRKPAETELLLAEAMGMKVEGEQSICGGAKYLHWEALLRDLPNMTTFTQPPHFSTDPRWIPILKQIAKEKFGIVLEEKDDPEKVAREFLNKLTD